MPDLRRERTQVVRFLLLGGANTAVTYGLFVLLAHVLPAQLAYTLVFGLGVVLSVFLTGTLVFGAERTLRRSALYACWYLVVYGVGSATLHLLGRLGVDRALLVGVGVLAVTTPLNYLGGRLLFRSTRLAPEATA